MNQGQCSFLIYVKIIMRWRRIVYLIFANFLREILPLISKFSEWLGLVVSFHLDKFSTNEKNTGVLTI